MTKKNLPNLYYITAPQHIVKPNKKPGESSKKKVASKKEIQKEEKPVERSNLKKSSKEKTPAKEKKKRKVVPGWGLTRGVHPPRFNPFLISCHFLVHED